MTITPPVNMKNSQYGFTYDIEPLSTITTGRRPALTLRLLFGRLALDSAYWFFAVFHKVFPPWATSIFCHNFRYVKFRPFFSLLPHCGTFSYIISKSEQIWTQMPQIHTRIPTQILNTGSCNIRNKSLYTPVSLTAQSTMGNDMIALKKSLCCAGIYKDTNPRNRNPVPTPRPPPMTIEHCYTAPLYLPSVRPEIGYLTSDNV